MSAWDQRPFEIANLLNPAFCSVLTRDFVASYTRIRKQGVPYPLLFLTLPIVLHRETRNSLPRTVSTKLHIWLQERPNLRISFADRVRRLLPYTKEAILFGMQAGILTTDSLGLMRNTNRTVRSPIPTKVSETEQCRRKAIFLGRWFAATGEVPTIYTMWGIAP